jgi:hypothetical protein
MNDVSKTNGSPWGIAAISNAEWEVYTYECTCAFMDSYMYIQI